MKMTPTWSKDEDHNEEHGTCLLGKMVCCYNRTDNPSPSYILSTLHIIGYDPSKKRDEAGAKYYTFTSLSDGLTNHYTLDELIDRLNKQPYVPVTQTEVAKAMLYKIPKK